MATPRRNWPLLDFLFQWRERQLKELYGPTGEMPKLTPRAWPQFSLRRLMIAVGLFALSLGAVLQAVDMHTFWALILLAIAPPAFGGGAGILVGRLWLGVCLGLLPVIGITLLAMLIS